MNKLGTDKKTEEKMIKLGEVAKRKGTEKNKNQNTFKLQSAEEK